MIREQMNSKVRSGRVINGKEEFGFKFTVV